VWAAAAGVVAALAWQVGAGSDGLLAGGGHVASAVSDLDGEASPLAAADRLWQPLADRPEALVQGAALVGAAMCVPLVMRARAGGPRIVAAGLWVTGLAALLVATSATGEAALGAMIPAAVVILAWAVRPWRSLRRRGPARASATLRGPIA
jgi:hypothetical protein